MARNASWTAEHDVADETRGSLKEWVLSQMFAGTLTIALSFPAPKILLKSRAALQGGRLMVVDMAAAWARRLSECPRTG